MDISLIASSVRPHLWDACLTSLLGNKCQFEVVFCGDLVPTQYQPYLAKYPFLRYIEVGYIKPAQCYEVARRAAEGKYVMWIADDCEFSEGLLDKAVSKMDTMGLFTLLSLRTNEDGKANDLDDHRFFGFNKNTPLMAPLGVINGVLLQRLGGFDRRYVCGQYENHCAMMVYEMGGQVVKYEEVCVTIEHLKKHGRGTKFWTAYDHDRKVLEDTWVVGGYASPERPMRIIKTDEVPQIQLYTPITNREVSKKPLVPFEPYDWKDITKVSQGPKGVWD